MTSLSNIFFMLPILGPVEIRQEEEGSTELKRMTKKKQLTTQPQAKNQETYYFDTELKHMTKQAVNTENALLLAPNCRRSRAAEKGEAAA